MKTELQYIYFVYTLQKLPMFLTQNKNHQRATVCLPFRGVPHWGCDADGAIHSIQKVALS